MADAQVLTPDQIQQLLAAQQQQASASSSAPALAPAPASGSASASASGSSQHRLKTSFKKRRSFEPFYTGGATALTPDGTLLFATLDEQVAVVEVSTGNVLQRIEGDTEQVTALAVSPSGSHLVVASRSLALRIFSLPQCKLVRSIPRSHLSQVNLMSIDPTSTLLATGGSDGVAKVWDLEAGYCTHAFKGHAGVVSALAWNLPPPSTASLSNGSSTSTPKKSKSKSKSKSYANGRDQRTIHLLTGSVDGKVRVWDLNNPTELHKPIATLTGHDSVVRGVAVTDDGSTLVSGSRDRTLVVWRLPPAKSGVPHASAAWKPAETLSANEGIESVGFLPANTVGNAQSVFWTGGSDGQIRLWDANTGSIIAKEPRSFNERLALQAKQDRKARAIAAGRTIDDLDADEEETRAIVAVHLVQAATACLVSVHADQNIVIRSLRQSALLRKQRQLIGFNDEIVDLALLSTGVSNGDVETHLAVATNSRSLRIYTLGEEDQTTAELLPGHTDIVLCLDRSPDLRLLASGAKDRTTRIWAWMPCSRLATPSSQNGADDAGQRVSRKLESSSNGGGDQGGEAVQGEWVCVGICEGHAESVGAIAFARRPSHPSAPGAPFIVTASQDRTVKLWDLSPINELLSSGSTRISSPIALKSLVTQRVHEKDINCLDVAPNNAMLATGSQDRTAKLFSLTFTSASPKSHTAASARLVNIATLKGHKRGVWACRFSPTDLALATSSGDKTIRLWSLKTFSSVKVFEGHTNSVLKLGFVSAGMQLVSCGGDGLLKVWNIKEEECMATVDAHDDKVWSIAVSRSEAWVVSAAADGTMKVWEDRTVEEEQEKREEREEEVRLEQQFGNMLTKRDWRNAIELALRLGQPRRLLGLFTHLSATRPEASSSTVGERSGLLADALASDSDEEEEDAMLEFGDLDGELAGQSTQRKGSAPRNTAASSQGADEVDGDARSITGLASVDQILSTLPPGHLIQLLGYIRDWNTSTRTSPIAQMLLHAILSTHSASSLLAIMDSAARTHRTALAQRLQDQQLGILPAPSDKQRARLRRLDSQHNLDLAQWIQAMIPYTQRHWHRIDRLAIESSLLDYSLQAMDTLLGPDNQQDQMEETMVEQGDQPTFGQQIQSDHQSQSEDQDDVLSDVSDSS